ncbi:hypothetical protein [Deinococcus sp.]|uniref:hypothetical protein n=1 Tax=Deinococcus sp. TaxID=47478 RepID=UPI0025F25EEF|nr:hypothetical protein [Deinococcus sp.]
MTPVTRQVLLERLDARQERQFLSEAEFNRLRAAAVRLVPHDPAEIDVIGPLDARLHSGLSGDGWRYADAPPDAEAYRTLLAALPGGFVTLSGEQQDEALRTVQSSHARAFEDLLSELAETFFAHPLTQHRIGYVGFADAPGWPNVGPNELEAREVSHGGQ